MRKFRHRFAPRPDDIDPETGQPIPCTGFPHITYFTAWNEPNLGQLDDAGSTKLKMRLYPYRAGQFWHELNRLCKETEPATTDHPFVPTCGVAAGDFIDKKTSFREPIVDRDTGRRYESYFDAYNAGRRKRAKIWAYHAYNAAKRSNDSSLFREFLRRTCKCGGNDPYNSGPPVWLTEQGAFRYQSTMEPGEPRVDKLKRTPLQANADAEFLLRLPGIGRRIKRFYWYSWKGDLNFDTGLLNRKNERNPDGTPKDYIRRVYCTFGHTVNPDYDHDPATPGLQPCAPEEDDNSPPG
jgi:hypothetical protein